MLEVALSLSPLDVARGDPEPAEGSKGETGAGGEAQVVGIIRESSGRTALQ